MNRAAAIGPIDLAKIPHIEVGGAGPLTLAKADPVRFQAIMAAGAAHYGHRALRIGDWLSAQWLKAAANPYRSEIADIAAWGNTPGAYLLNLSYEWTCTTATAADTDGVGNRLLRTLDWPLDGLGRHVVVARMAGPAGAYENITWPGFTGVATAMAPGRFAAALNQPPMRRWSFSCWLDWAVNRTRLWRRRALPPVHLLRHVFDTCRTYAEAKQALMETPLAMPAFITLSGLEPGEGCVVERQEDRAHVRNAPASVANHWIAAAVPGRTRGVDSHGRHALMETLHNAPGDSFDWLQPPILNATTRLAVVANAAKGTLTVQGWEKDGPATQVFHGGK